MTPVLLAGNAPVWMVLTASDFSCDSPSLMRYSVGGHCLVPAEVPEGYESLPRICRDLGIASNAICNACVRGRLESRLIRHRCYARREDVQAYLDGRGVGGRPRVSA
jgi:hypothetical protein